MPNQAELSGGGGGGDYELRINTYTLNLYKVGCKTAENPCKEVFFDDAKTSRSVSSVPWITPAIRRKIRRKNATHARAKKVR